MTPVFIPTKGRATTMKTASHFTDQSKVFLVVEKEDEPLYREAGYDNFLVLPKSNQGIAYVRNWILTHALLDQLDRYWMLDDDISQFTKYTGSKGEKITGEEACAKAEKDIIWNTPNVGQGAMEYTQFAWSAKKDIVAPGYCDVAVLMFPKKIPNLRYRSELRLKEDRDFTLQVLASGLLTARSTRIAFACPKNGSNAGGLADEYAAKGRELLASQHMCKIWPGVCTMNVKPDGREDVKIAWKSAFKFKEVKFKAARKKSSKKF